MAMELSSDILGPGKNDQKKESMFEWNAKPQLTKQNRAVPQGIPFAAECNQRQSKVIGDDGCEGCPSLDHGICLKHNEQNKQKKSAHPVYSKEARELLAGIAIQILKGLPFHELKGFLLSKYSREFLNDSTDLLRPWLLQPGFLGLVLIDTRWFDSCSSAAEMTRNLAFAPSYVAEKEECHGCQYNNFRKCTLIKSRIFGPLDKITSDAVIRHIDEMQSRNTIPQMIAENCRKRANVDPLDGLMVAVKAARDLRTYDESDFLQNLKNVGNEAKAGDAVLFENEPVESQEAKMLLSGPEMTVEINPRYEYENVEYFHSFRRGSGFDAYLK